MAQLNTAEQVQRYLGLTNVVVRFNENEKVQADKDAKDVDVDRTDKKAVAVFAKALVDQLSAGVIRDYPSFWLQCAGIAILKSDSLSAFAVDYTPIVMSTQKDEILQIEMKDAAQFDALVQKARTRAMSGSPERVTSVDIAKQHLSKFVTAMAQFYRNVPPRTARKYVVFSRVMEVFEQAYAGALFVGGSGDVVPFSEGGGGGGQSSKSAMQIDDPRGSALTLPFPEQQQQQQQPDLTAQINLSVPASALSAGDVQNLLNQSASVVQRFGSNVQQILDQQSASQRQLVVGLAQRGQELDRDLVALQSQNLSLQAQINEANSRLIIQAGDAKTRQQTADLNSRLIPALQYADTANKQLVATLTVTKKDLADASAEINRLQQAYDILSAGNVKALDQQKRALDYLATVDQKNPLQSLIPIQAIASAEPEAAFRALVDRMRMLDTRIKELTSDLEIEKTRVAASEASRLQEVKEREKVTAELRAALDNATADRVQQQRREIDLASEIKGRDSTILALRGQVNQSQSETGSVRSRVANIELQLKAAQQAEQTAQNRVLELDASISRFTNTATDKSAQLNAVKEQLERERKDTAALRDQVTQLTERLANSEAKVNSSQLQVVSVTRGAQDRLNQFSSAIVKYGGSPPLPSDPDIQLRLLDAAKTVIDAQTLDLNAVSVHARDLDSKLQLVRAADAQRMRDLDAAQRQVNDLQNRLASVSSTPKSVASNANAFVLVKSASDSFSADKKSVPEPSLSDRAYAAISTMASNFVGRSEPAQVTPSSSSSPARDVKIQRPEWLFEIHALLIEMCQDQVMSLAIVDMLDKHLGGTYIPQVGLQYQLWAMVNPSDEDFKTRLMVKLIARKTFALDLLVVYSQIKRRGILVDQINQLRPPSARGVTYTRMIAQSIIEWMRTYEAVIRKRQTPKNAGAVLWWAPASQSVDTIKHGFAELKVDILILDSALRVTFVKSDDLVYAVMKACALRDGEWIGVYRDLCGVLWNAEDLNPNYRIMLDQPGGCVVLASFLKWVGTNNDPRIAELIAEMDRTTQKVMENLFGAGRVPPSVVLPTLAGNGRLLRIANAQFQLPAPTQSLLLLGPSSTDLVVTTNTSAASQPDLSARRYPATQAGFAQYLADLESGGPSGALRDRYPVTPEGIAQYQADLGAQQNIAMQTGQ